MGEACGDRVKTIKTTFVAEKSNFFGKKVLSGERFRIKGLFYTSYNMAISAQNPMLKVNYFLDSCKRLGTSRLKVTRVKTSVLFLVSNLSLLNFRFFLLMYPGSLPTGSWKTCPQMSPMDQADGCRLGVKENADG